jgi:hypothetical protein
MAAMTAPNEPVLSANLARIVMVKTCNKFRPSSTSKGAVTRPRTLWRQGSGNTARHRRESARGFELGERTFRDRRLRRRAARFSRGLSSQLSKGSGARRLGAHARLVQENMAFREPLIKSFTDRVSTRMGWLHAKLGKAKLRLTLAGGWPKSRLCLSLRPSG